MAAVGYHRAPRSAGAPWVRIVLALALIIPAMAMVAGPAAAAASLQVKLLKDLDTGNSGGDSSVWVTDPVNAGTNYYFAATVADDTELYVSDGIPGGTTTKLDVNGSGSSTPANLTPIPGTNKILFTAVNGSEGGAGPRLFVSDGTPAGTGPFRPAFFGASPGFGGSPGAAEGLYQVGGPVTTSTKGLVFSALVDKTGTANDSEFEYILGTTDGVTVSAPFLDAGGSFEYRHAGWGPPTAVANGDYPDPTGFLASVGDVVYASWSDCDPVAVDFACQSPYTGDELHALDLNLTGIPRQWTPPLTESAMGEDKGPSTTFGRPLGATALGILFFEAHPADGAAGIYRTNGSLAGTFEVATDWTYGASAETTVMGSYLYYVSDDGTYETLRRVTTTAASSEPVITCEDGTFPLEQEVVSSTLYFACDLADGDAVTGGDQYSGIELFGVTSSAIGASNPSIVYNAPDAEGGMGGDGLYPMYLTAFDSKLYFSALDTTAYTDRQLWVYTGTGAPLQTGGDLKNPGNDNVTNLAVAGTSLFLRAEDGTHGNEPFVARISYFLEVDGSGTGTGTVTGGLAPINCTVTAGVEGVSGCSGQEAGTITLTAAADPLSTFDGWTGCDSTSGTGNVVCTIAMSGDKTVQPAFTLDTATSSYQLDVLNDGGSGKGLVTGVPDGGGGTVIRCGADCTETFDAETDVVLTAKPAKGSEFREWSDTCVPDNLDPLVCTVTADDDSAPVEVTATFELLRKLTVTKTGAGALATTVTSSPAGITCGSQCSASIADDLTVTLVAALQSGSGVTWSGVTCTNDAENDAPSCVFSMTGGAKSVTADISAPTSPPTYYTLTLANRTGDTITSSPAGISCGNVCAYSFPNTGSITLSITVSKAGYKPSTSGLTWTLTTGSTYTATVATLTANTKYSVRLVRV